ncbi:hypothetical protein CDA63_11820 [Hymenobacter amundsenii]|uniref:Fibronectin type-III domain-containing protein n=1 Tax=Hymenobacter amundsenii TaxID=2006685 RepID=A0A246FK30_9BACT|nr:fibronectin type III domain-containing protein [Hymenobacter amundsenii]OWP62899.1 hypothetical protein CDA63_11820 [Hymenobacter amundsenii]
MPLNILLHLRTALGRRLSHAEVDANFANLRDAIQQLESQLMGGSTTPPASSVSWNGKPLLLVFGGDSRNDASFGQFGAPINRVATALGATYTGANFTFSAANYDLIWTARGGNTVAAQLAAELPPIDAKYCGGIHLFEGGVNSVRQSDTPTAATVGEEVRQQMAKAKAAGYKTVVSTITDCDHDYQARRPADAGYAGPQVQVRIDAVNTIIRANWQTWGVDGFEDLSSHQYIDPIAYPSSYVDGIHPSDIGIGFEAKSKYDRILALNAQYFAVPVPAYEWVLPIPAAATGGSGGTPAVPGQVTGLALTPSDQALTAAWNAPAANGAAITNYAVQLRDTGQNGNVFVAVTRSASATAIQLLSGLVNGLNYQVKVAAINSVGTGPFSDAATASPRLNTGPGIVGKDSDLLTYLPERSFYAFDEVGGGRAYVSGARYGGVKIGFTGTQVRVIVPLFGSGDAKHWLLANGAIAVQNIDANGPEGTTRTYLATFPTAIDRVLLYEREVYDANSRYWMFQAFEALDGGFYKVPV